MSKINEIIKVEGLIVKKAEDEGFVAERRYDKDGNLAYYRTSDGREWWAEYENGRIIYCEDSNGNKRWVEYPAKGIKQLELNSGSYFLDGVELKVAGT